MYTNYVSADGYDNGDSDENDYANEVETQWWYLQRTERRGF
jgi:hypothetical protein